MYLELIKNFKVDLPIVRENTIHGFHLFVIQVMDRSKFIKYLKKKN